MPKIPLFSMVLSMITFRMDMASAVIVFPNISISGGPTLVSSLLSPRASVTNAMPALNE